MSHPRQLEIEDSFECHNREVSIFVERDCARAYKYGEQPPVYAPESWAWGFIEGVAVETIYLGFATKDDAISAAWQYRREQLEDAAADQWEDA